MCIGAIYWARPKAIYYACTKQEAAKIGFDDQFIYDQLALEVEYRKIPMKKVFPDQGDIPFRTWEKSNQKIKY